MHFAVTTKMRHPETQELVAELENTQIPVFTLRGRNGGTFVVKSTS